MPNENASNNPSNNPDAQPASQFPMPQPTPEKNEMGRQSNYCANHETTETEKLEKDIKAGEYWLIGINASLLIANIVIACIYYGQLCQMRKAVVAAEGANNIANNTLISARRAWVGLKDAPVISLSTLNVNYSIVLKNFGPSPALRIDMVVLPMGMMDVTENVFDKLCANASTIAQIGPDPSLPNYGHAIFPEQPETINSYGPWVGTPPLDQPFAFVGCIAYVDEFHDGPTKTPIRHTRFCFATDAPIKTLLTAQNHVLAGSAYTKDCPLGHLAD